jgi:hypothetical protein
VHPFGGRLELPVPTYPLTASTLHVSLGLPARVIPIALLGGDQPAWSLDGGDLFAVLFAFVVARLAVRVPPDAPRRRARRLRLLGGAVLAGLWFLSPGAYVTTVVVLTVVGLLWVLGRMFRGLKLAAGAILLLGALGVFFLVMMASVGVSRKEMSGASYDAAPPAPVSTAPAAAEEKRARDGTGNWRAQNAVGGVLEGVTPVALNLPSSARSVHASRELVTRERPFRPVLIYVTSLSLWPLGLVWLAGAIALFLAHRGPFGEAARWVRVRLLREEAVEGAEGVEEKKGEAKKVKGGGEGAA